MKFLNFGKVKKAVKKLIKSLAFLNKKKYRKEAAALEKLAKETKENWNRTKGGYKHYTYILKPLFKNGHIVYRNFRKQILPGSIFINGKKHYRIEINPHYAN